MAVFSLGSGTDLNNLDSMDKVKSYLFTLTEQLRYMFNNLDPEENYSEKARLTMVTDGERQATIEASLNGVLLNYVSKDGIVSAINLSDELIQIEASKIKLEGVVTVNGNFKVGLDGSIKAKNGRFQGAISGSNISLGGNANTGYIVVYNGSGGEIGRWDKNGISVKSGSFNIGNKFVVGTDGKLKATDGEFTGDISGSTITGGTIAIGNKFSVDANGNLTATGGTFTGNISGSTITGSHIYSSYYGTTSDDFYITANGDDTVVGISGWTFEDEIMYSNWIGNVENPASNGDTAGMNGRTGNAGFHRLYLLDDWYIGKDGSMWDVTRTLRWLDNRIAALERSCSGDCSDSDDSDDCSGDSCDSCDCIGDGCSGDQCQNTP